MTELDALPDRIECTSLPEPEPRSPLQTSFHGSSLTPAQIVWFYSPDDWEDFVREWARSFTHFTSVKRLGGAYDRGADVAAFLTERKFEGPWECYQAKHYNEPIGPAIAYPEMLKLFAHVLDGAYTYPARYRFVAPRGCGPKLEALLSSPKDLRAAFLEFLSERKLSTARLTRVKSFAETADYSIFDSLSTEDMLSQHGTTRYHSYRFGRDLAPRDTTEPKVPNVVHAGEQKYVSKLIEAYSENDPPGTTERSDPHARPANSRHFARQRLAFYSAESLRMYARENVEPGLFQLMLNDVYEGVIETVERSHPSGLERLASVLDRAGDLPMDNHTLSRRTIQLDRRGMCHQLANADRLTWVFKEFT